MQIEKNVYIKIKCRLKGGSDCHHLKKQQRATPAVKGFLKFNK